MVRQSSPLSPFRRNQVDFLVFLDSFCFSSACMRRGSTSWSSLSKLNSVCCRAAHSSRARPASRSVQWYSLQPPVPRLAAVPTGLPSTQTVAVKQTVSSLRRSLTLTFLRDRFIGYSPEG